MEYLFFLIFFVLFLSLIFFFSKKLIALLILEGCMLCMIYFYSFYHSSSFFCFLNMFIFSVFMVLDSVFGLCCLINSGRNSSICSTAFSTF